MYGVILAGGSGTRFWPLSRKKLPKQFLKLFNNKTLLEETTDRLIPFISKKNIIIVTTDDYRDRIKQIVKGVPPGNIITEPVGRNTAPAIAVAAFKLIEQGESVMGVFPSDHLILESKRFRRILSIAERIAQSSKHLITLGIKPTRPETGYGYIQLDNIYKRENGIDIFKVKRFVEKPDRKRARRFLESGKFMWNSGTFVWRIDVFLKELEANLPDVYYGIKRGMKIKKNGEVEINEKIYKSLPGISVDYGIMEKSQRRLIIPIDIGWSDLGSWDSLADVLKKDESGNSVIADGKSLLNVKNSLFYTRGKYVSAIGIKDIIVVESGNAILVCKKKSSQDVKKIVDFLTKKKEERFL